LTARAGGGEALVDDATRSGAGGFNFIGAETVTVNSRSAQVPTYRLVLEGPAAADGIEPIIVLMRSSLFADLPPQLAGALRRRVHRRTFPAGAYIAREGEPADSLFVIEHGLVRVSRTSQHGRELVLGLLTVGETLGELGVLDASGTRTADALAVELTTCVTLSRHDLHTVIRTAPELGLRLMSRLVGYVRRKDEELAEIAFLDVPGRLANKLLQLAANHGEPVDGGVRIRVKVPQSELAAMVGASREHVNRALGRLIVLNAVSVERGTITILDSDRLRSMC
jgi:CRP/FNR family transcriptional regulator, cyclic AMP receptor protein